MLAEWWHHRHRHRAHSIEFTFRWGKFKVKGDFMQFTMLASQQVSVVGSPVIAQTDANGNPIPSNASLSNVNYTSSDPTVFTVAADPSTPNGAIITGVGPGTATLTETATATEADGTTTEQIQGVATIVITAVTPPVSPAAALVFTFGTPTTLASAKK